MSQLTWYGDLHGVELRDGTYVRLPRVAIGDLPGVGIVTAPDRAALEAGRLYRSSRGQPVDIAAVYYIRRRRGRYPGLKWRHAVHHGRVILGDTTSPPLFINPAPRLATRVCPRLPESFMCEADEV